MHHRGVGVRGNLRRATLIYTKGCDLGDGSACLTLGEIERDNVGGETHADAARHLRRALELLQRECDARDAESCGNLGYAYERGVGVSRDPARALRYLDQGCALGSAACCDVAALRRRIEGPL